MTDTDFTQRFIFDNHDARGELASLEQSYAHVLAKHDYPEPVRILLGELMAAAALLVGSLKFDGLLTLQVRGDGPLSLLVVECSSNREMRGLARYDAGRVHGGASLQELMPDSVLAMTVDPEGGQRYQGLVALDGDSLAACLNAYFASSEQLESRFALHADGRRARGFLLQQLPAAQVPQGEQRAASWQHLTTLAQTLSAEELLRLDNSTVLHRLYHEEDVRLFDAQQVQFSCNCSRERRKACSAWVSTMYWRYCRSKTAASKWTASFAISTIRLPQRTSASCLNPVRAVMARPQCINRKTLA